MLCVKALLCFALIVHLEGHELEERQVSTNAEDIVRDLYRWKTESDQKLAALETRMRTMQASMLPPVGFIYIQYKQQVWPKTLWPRATWMDVSNQYGGAFFRAEGGRSRPFGQDQQESMRPLRFEFLNKATKNMHTLQHFIESNNVTVITGGYGGDRVGLSISRFENDKPYKDRRFTDNEYRPYNQAVRIWKRTG